MEKSKCSIPTNDDNVDEDVIDNVDEEMIENVDDEVIENAEKFGGGDINGNPMKKWKNSNVPFPRMKIWVLDWISPILKFANVRFPWMKIWVLDRISPILKFVTFAESVSQAHGSCKGGSKNSSSPLKKNS